MILSGKTNSSTIKWDVSEFPLVCEPCFGSNPYIRMSKAEFDMECKICFRPFTVFRWKTDNNRFKRTEICQTCAKVKNLCQACILDLKFGLSMELRDSYMKETINVPKDPINRDYWAYKVSKNIDKMELPYDKPENYTILERYLKTKGLNTTDKQIKQVNENKNNLELKENGNDAKNLKQIDANNHLNSIEQSVKHQELYKDIIDKKNRLISPDIILNLVTINDYLGDIDARVNFNKKINETKLKNDLKNKLDKLEDIQIEGNVFKQDNSESKNKKKKWKKLKNIKPKELEPIDNDPLKFSK